MKKFRDQWGFGPVSDKILSESNITTNFKHRNFLRTATRTVPRDSRDEFGVAAFTRIFSWSAIRFMLLNHKCALNWELNPLASTSVENES